MIDSRLFEYFGKYPALEDFADAIPEDMVGFAMLVDGGFQAREDDLPLTCKYKELSEGQTRTPCP
eukprot:1176747-Amphidinium_carterae.1